MASRRPSPRYRCQACGWWTVDLLAIQQHRFLQHEHPRLANPLVRGLEPVLKRRRRGLQRQPDPGIPPGVTVERDEEGSA